MRHKFLLSTALGFSVVLVSGALCFLRTPTELPVIASRASKPAVLHLSSHGNSRIGVEAKLLTNPGVSREGHRKVFHRSLATRNEEKAIAAGSNVERDRPAERIAESFRSRNSVVGFLRDEHSEGITSSSTTEPKSSRSLKPAPADRSQSLRQKEANLVSKKTVILPAVLLEPDPKIKLTSQQVEEWESLQDVFITQIGGPDRNADDPSYRESWVSAQEVSDARFRQKFGTQAFLQQSIQSLRMEQSW